eukprot:2792283-Pleurochrysis_carterae.AAC.1
MPYNCRNRRRAHFISSLACIHFCIGIVCVLAERSRSAPGFLATVRAWPTSPRCAPDRSHGAGKLAPPPAPLPSTDGCWYYN